MTNNNNINNTPMKARRGCQDCFGLLSETETETERDALLVELTAAQRDYYSYIYLLIMFFVGAFLISISEAIYDLASNCGTEATKVGTVFALETLGSVLSALGCSILYKKLSNHTVLAVSLLLAAICMQILPFVTSTVVLYLLYFCVGCVDALVGTGSQIILSKAQPENVGVWLGGAQFMFTLGASSVLFLNVYVLTGVMLQFTFLAVALGTLSIIVFFMKDFKVPKAIKDEEDLDDTVNNASTPPPHYHTELLVGVVILFVIGGAATINGYLTSFVVETGVESENTAELQLACFWLLMTFGIFFAVLDLMHFVTPQNLPYHFAIALFGGAVTLALVLFVRSSEVILWVCVIFYGTLSGSCVTFAYKVISEASDDNVTAMSIASFMFSIGTGFVPAACAGIWDAGGGPYTLFVTCLLCMLLSIPFLFAGIYMSYKPNVNIWYNFKNSTQGYSIIPESGSF